VFTHVPICDPLPLDYNDNPTGLLIHSEKTLVPDGSALSLDKFLLSPMHLYSTTSQHIGVNPGVWRSRPTDFGVGERGGGGVSIIIL